TLLRRSCHRALLAPRHSGTTVGRKVWNNRAQQPERIGSGAPALSVVISHGDSLACTALLLAIAADKIVLMNTSDLQTPGFQIGSLNASSNEIWRLRYTQDDRCRPHPWRIGHYLYRLCVQPKRLEGV